MKSVRLASRLATARLSNPNLEKRGAFSVARSAIVALQTRASSPFSSNGRPRPDASSLLESTVSRVHFSTTSTSSAGDKKVVEEIKVGADTVLIEEKPKSKVRILWEKYGYVFLGFYGSLYLVTLGTVYEFVALKHIDAHGVVNYLHTLGVDKLVDVSPIANSKSGNFALAWILTKFTEPLRLAFTVSITPTLSRALGYAPPRKIKEKGAEATVIKTKKEDE